MSLFCDFCASDGHSTGSCPHGNVPAYRREIDRLVAEREREDEK